MVVIWRIISCRFTGTAKIGIKDSYELAWQDWLGTAGFDREDDEDYWGKKWAEAYVKFAAERKTRMAYGSRAFVFSLWSVGRNAAVILRKGLEIQFLGFISFGEPAGHC